MTVDLLLVPIAVIYLLVVASLFVYGVNFFYLTYLSWKKRGAHLPPSVLHTYPIVTVQLPIYNEKYVAERLILAAVDLDYPAECLEIQVLDDSTDETRHIVARLVTQLAEDGVDIVHLHREMRTGYKAGALAKGFAEAKGEFMAIFDADFIPPSGFLKQTIPYFQGENGASEHPVGFIQTRWGHVNRNYSFLTLLQSLAIDAHFMVEQHARSQGGYWFNFNGTAGIWRREAIIAAGGWKAETLTEDLDLSYRAFLNGWKGIYLRDIVVPAELPVSFSAYRRQQHRWARGSLECAIELIPSVWQSPISILKRIEATLHLTGYGVHLLLFSLTLLYPFILLLSIRYPALVSLFGVAAIFNATAFAPTIFFIVAQAQLGNRWWRAFPVILFITSLGAGMMLNTVRAAWQILRGGSAKFERTPKFGILKKGQNWKRRLYQLSLDPLVYIELIFAGLNLVTVALAFYLGNWIIGVYAAIFAVGLVFTSGLTIAQSLSVAWGRARSRNRD